MMLRALSRRFARARRPEPYGLPSEADLAQAARSEADGPVLPRGGAALDAAPSERARRFWDGQHGRDAANREASTPERDPIDYTRHWFLYNHAVSRPLTGDCAKYWLDDVGSRYLRPPPERMLALGSGLAFIEEQILERDFAARILAFERSPVAVESARARLSTTPYAGRMEIRCGDPLEAGLEDATFDAVFVEAAIHHFTQIEPMFKLMHRVLRPGGLLLYDEYVGPDHHQYPDELSELLTRVNECLAPELRRDFETGEVRSELRACPLEDALARDPTEGVHASEILPLTYEYFDVIDRRDYGGTIVRPLFNRILLNWDFEHDAKDQTIARLIVLLEQELLKAGAIQTHQAVVVARRKPSP